MKNKLIWAAFIIVGFVITIWNFLVWVEPHKAVKLMEWLTK